MTSPTLLGHLARFASFTMQSELLCTQGLAYLLNTYKEAHSGMADAVEARTGVRIGDSLKWVPEALHDDGSRPDLEAQRADGVPVMNIEAKLGAALLPAQLRSYVGDLLKRNSGESVLLVLVPQTRIAEVTRVTAETFDQSGSGLVAVSIISWDELFATLQSRGGERFHQELEQLQAMYYELSSHFIAPLASDEDLLQWRSSETDFVNLIDQVTQRLTTTPRLLPIGTESLEGEASPEREPAEYCRRYVCAGNAASCFSIGVRDSFAEWVTPVWMRFHKDTSNFELTRQRIELSNVKSLQSRGHVWIPLDVPPNVTGEQMIEALVEQTEEVIRVAYQTE